MDLLLATTNPAKLARLRWLVAGLPFTVLTPADLPGVAPAVPEEGGTFAENAVQKARAWSRAAAGRLTVASDGGLVIPALGARWEALRTRRNAGESATPADRLRHLLALMEGLRGEERRALWCEAVAVDRGAPAPVAPSVWELQGDGGVILDRLPDGSLDSPFWTESIRYYPAVGKVYRDLDEQELQAMDQVWPRLRERVHAYLLDELAS